jgi:hypothetical protein
LTHVAALVIDALGLDASGAARRSVIGQYFGLLYPFWLLEYRRVRSWRFAAGVARGMRPGRTLAGAGASMVDRALAVTIFGAATVFGLTAPTRLLAWVRRPATRIARIVVEMSAAPTRT